MFLYNINAYAQVEVAAYTNKKTDNKWSAYIEGFIQADVMVDFQKNGYKDGFMAPFIEIPQNNSVDGKFSINQSQIGLGVKRTDSEGNSDLSAYVEIDFFGPYNTTRPRLRQGYVQWKKLLIGQAWSNFTDFDAFPAILDFVGPNAMLFLQVLQIRYTTPLSAKSELSLSIEDPNVISALLPNDRRWKKKHNLPSFTALYKYTNENNYIKVGGLLSPIRHEVNDELQQKSAIKTTLGFAGMVSGKVYSKEKNNFIFQSSYGRGYATHNTVLNEARYDAIPNLDRNRLQAMKLFNIYGVYEHWWAAKLSSTAYYSYSRFGKGDFIPGKMVQKFQNIGVNFIYYPYEKVRIGVEGNYGQMSNFDKERTNGVRLQFASTFYF